MDDPINDAPPAEVPAQPQTEQARQTEAKTAPDWTRSGTLDTLLQAEKKQETAPAQASEPAPQTDTPPPATQKVLPAAPTPFDRASLPDDVRQTLDRAEKYSVAIDLAEKQFDGNDAIQAQIDKDATERFVNEKTAERLADRHAQLSAEVRDNLLSLENAQAQYNAEFQKEAALVAREVAIFQAEKANEARAEAEAGRTWEAEYTRAIDAHDVFKLDTTEGADNTDAADARALVRALAVTMEYGTPAELAKEVSDMLTQRDKRTEARVLAANKQAIEQAAVTRYATRQSAPPAAVYGNSNVPTSVKNNDFQFKSLDELMAQA